MGGSIASSSVRGGGGSIGGGPILSLNHPSMDMSNSAGNRNSRNLSNKNPAAGAAVENDRILQILLNLIETLADDSLNLTRTQLNAVGAGTAGSLGIAAITKMLVKSPHIPAASTSTSASATTAGVATTGAAVVTAGTTVIGNGRPTSAAIPIMPMSIGVYGLPPLALGSPIGGLTRQNSINHGGDQRAAAAAAGNAAMQGGVHGLPQLEGDDEEILRQGAIFFSPLMRVDSAAVLCSAALCNLAEVPQCRPGLVTSGALKMIKSWLEIGNDVLAQARVLCFNKLTSPRSFHASRLFTGGNAFDSTAAAAEDYAHNQQLKDSCNAFMDAFGPAYELISNAAAALMHLSGGTDCRFTALGAAAALAGGHTSSSHRSGGSSHGHGHGHGHGGSHHGHSSHGAVGGGGGGGRDYIVGWIDAQILAEGLPGVVSDCSSFYNG